MILTSQHKLNQWYFSQGAFERSAIIEKNRNWSCIAMEKEYIESVRGFSTAWHHLIFPWLIDWFNSIVFDLTNSATHVYWKPPFSTTMSNVTVNLAFRSSLIEWFHCSSTCKREKTHNSGEVYEHEKSNTNRIEEDTNNTAKESWYTYSSIWVVEGIVLTRIPYELLKGLCWLKISKIKRIDLHLK